MMLRRGALLVIVGLPVFLSFNFVLRFAVDVPFWDQWELVPQLEKLAQGDLGFSDLIAPHNEHRIVVPRALMLLLSQLSGWDTRWESWLNWLLLLGLGAVLFAEHLRTFGREAAGLISFVPTAWLVFSLRQEENLLWGWQLPITLCALSAAASLAVLSSGERTVPRLAAAIALGALCTFSFSAGVAIWPAGLGLLGWRWRAAAAKPMVAWLLAGAVALALYFWGFQAPPRVSPFGLALERPGEAMRFGLAVLGAPLAADTALAACVAGGAMLAALCVALAALALRGAMEVERAALGVGLVAFGATTVAAITLGRLSLGVPAAVAGRYTTLTLLAIVGLWRCALAVRPEAARHALAGATAVLIALGTASALETEYTIGTAVRRSRLQAREALLDWRNRSDEQLQGLYPSAAVVRERAAALERLRTSVFRDR